MRSRDVPSKAPKKEPTMKAYLIKRSGDGETFLKVGVTKLNDTSVRHNFEKTKLVDSDLPWEEKLLRALDGEKYVDDDAYPEVHELARAEFDFDCQALFVEHKLLSDFKHIQYVPKRRFSGSTECFIYTPDNQETLKESFERETENIIGDLNRRLYYSLCAADIRETDPIKRHLRIMEDVIKGLQK
jgi:hypothetical protein